MDFMQVNPAGTKCWNNLTLNQHWIDIVSMMCAYWEGINLYHSLGYAADDKIDIFLICARK